jgi:threonine/homoserine/homoserine lactone efflux protein
MESLGILHLGAFVLAGLLLNLTPGPDLVYTSTQAGQQGTRAGWVAALGIGAGGLVHVTLGALGVSALLATSAAAFTALKLLGATWLVWLGVRMLVALDARPSDAAAGDAASVRPAAAPRPSAAIFREAILVSVLNPKVALFFLAFVPQFIDPSSPRPALAFIALGALFVANGTLVTGAVGTLAAAAAASFRSHPADRGWGRCAAIATRWLPRAIGAAFVGLGLRLALAER